MAVSTSADTNSTSTAPKSTHVSDPTLKPFLQPTFDPADYLNATLPSLALSSVSSRPLKQNHAVSLADLSSQTQDLLSQLNAHTTRLSTILTQLTDDILRSGSRLAYEVEVLRGDTIGLTETLTDTLNPDIGKFLPGGIGISLDSQAAASEEQDDTAPRHSAPAQPTPSTTPAHITSLHTLTLVRSRLESVIKIFGEAMHWTLPPSETSLTSSLISVSAPADDPAAPSDPEQRGKDFAAALRSEISDLITGSDELSAGAEAAELRIQALRDLAGVWKGTAEEKARVRFVEGLVKLAEEKQREWVIQRQRVGKAGSVRKAEQEVAQAAQKGGGFLDNLQRLRF